MVGDEVDDRRLNDDNFECNDDSQNTTNGTYINPDVSRNDYAHYDEDNERRINMKIETSMEIDAKDIATRYANDIIATCAFGLRVDSLSDRDNHFYRMGNKSTLGFKALLTVWGYGSVPRLMKMFKMAIFPEDVREFFKQIVLNTMNERKAHNIFRPDMIHLLMEAKKVLRRWRLVVGIELVGLVSSWNSARMADDSPVDKAALLKDPTAFSNPEKGLEKGGLNKACLSKARRLVSVSAPYKRLLMMESWTTTILVVVEIRRLLLSDRKYKLKHRCTEKTEKETSAGLMHDTPTPPLDRGQLTHDENSANDADAGFATAKESTVGKRNVKRGLRRRRSQDNLIGLYKNGSDTCNALGTALLSEHDMSACELTLEAAKVAFGIQKLNVWSDNDLTAQAAFFVFAGFETVSTAMTFLMYELAVNPEIQERLAREIKDHDKANGGKFDYNSVQTMTYLDMVVSEVLRLWPPAIAADRLCVKEYNLGKPYETAPADYIVKVNDSIHIPIFSIHRDPRYYPNPLKFDPERFSDENKHNIQPFTYMPFGVGPRNCIGSRFALCEVKVMIYRLLLHMKLEPSKRTPIPVKLSTGSFNLKMRGGHWLQLRARD
ncbi:hypothetical protein MSG28_004383 [Choristoneura fumiferana]|uniref:Uncharacterized protein n=1 Tax=Choristoneura fumiferana TaxID=7141 RepID=A0ACC0KIP4_CHOFU|nr:hypothetical protein MSG28_004383 [Choristoneura fumiferana]